MIPPVPDPLNPPWALKSSPVYARATHFPVYEPPVYKRRAAVAHQLEEYYRELQERWFRAEGQQDHAPGGIDSSGVDHHVVGGGGHQGGPDYMQLHQQHLGGDYGAGAPDVRLSRTASGIVLIPSWGERGGRRRGMLRGGGGSLAWAGAGVGGSMGGVGEESPWSMEDVGVRFEESPEDALREQNLIHGLAHALRSLVKFCWDCVCCWGDVDHVIISWIVDWNYWKRFPRYIKAE